MHKRISKLSRHKTRSIRPAMEGLEWRQLLSAAYPTANEQLMLEMVNRARANPTAEATRYGIDLNEGLSAGTISSSPKQPLAFNPYLIDSARGHSQDMIDQDYFAHNSPSGSTPSSRMTASGYTSARGWGENIAWSGSSTVPNETTTTMKLEDNLFIDGGVASRGHRLNILNASYKEAGMGVVSGVYTSSGRNYNAVMATQDFAYPSSGTFLTGVAYTDAMTHDSFYTPGEGLGGVNITAKRAADNAQFSTSTWTSGGYTLKLDPGTYVVTASGAGLPSPITLSNVIIGTQNVKADFVPNRTVTPPPQPTVPATPSALSATAASATQVNLKWTDNSNNETGFQIDRATDSAFSQNRTTTTVAAGVSAYASTGLSAGTTYYYRVRAVNAAGNSPYSNTASATTPVPTTPGTGLKAEYFDNLGFSGLKVTRVDPTINFNWGQGAPDSSMGPNSFSVRWTGQILPKASETYTFYTTSDDGVRLWVNGQLLIDNWTNHLATTNTGSIALQAGRKYDIRMEYYENSGDAVAKLEWSSPSIARQVVPQSQLYPPSTVAAPATASAAAPTGSLFNTNTPILTNRLESLLA